MTLSVLLIPLNYLACWPLFSWWYHRQNNGAASRLAIFLTSLSLSTGWLAFALFWIGLLPGRPLNLIIIGSVLLLPLILGIAVNPGWFSFQRWSSYWRLIWNLYTKFDMQALVLWSITAILGFMFLHAIYYPFIGSDTLSRYALHAQTIYLTSHIPETLFGYPLLAQLNFAATWFLAGSVNEFLAKLLPAIMSGGVIGATYLIGRLLYNHTGGLLAALLVALTPLFINNGTLAYVDVPATFPLTLALYFVLLWWKSGQTHDALLAGILLGIGLITKQSGLTWVASIIAVPCLWIIVTRADVASRSSHHVLPALLSFVIPVLIIALPWYTRNWLLGGPKNILPIAGAYHIQQIRSLSANLIPPLGWLRDFGYVTGPILAIGWVWGFTRSIQQGWHIITVKATLLPAELLIGIMLIPYWVAWLAVFAFEARFLVFILPLIALWSVQPLLWFVEKTALAVKLPARIWQLLVALLLISTFYISGYDRVRGAYWIATEPLASYEEKQLRFNSRTYNLIIYIRENLDPTTDRLCLMDPGLQFYLPEYETLVINPRHLSELADNNCDYLVHSSGFVVIYKKMGWNTGDFYQYLWHPEVFEAVYVSEGVHIMRVLRTSPPPAPAS